VITIFITQFNTIDLFVAYTLDWYVVHVVLRINNGYFPKDNNWHIFVMEKRCVSANWTFLKLRGFLLFAELPVKSPQTSQKILRLTISTQDLLVFPLPSSKCWECFGVSSRKCMLLMQPSQFNFIKLRHVLWNAKLCFQITHNGTENTRHLFHNSVCSFVLFLLEGVPG
jgi:hypothetical protein